MDHFFKYFKQDFGEIWHYFWGIFENFFYFIGRLFNFSARKKILADIKSDFTVAEWIMMVISTLVLLALCAAIVWFIIKLVRRLFRFRVPVQEFEAQKKQLKDLQHDLLRAQYEKDKLLEILAAKLGISPTQLQDELSEDEAENEEESEEYVESGKRNTFDSPCVDPNESRFFRLTSVDNFYKTEYQKPNFDNEITLAQLCERFRAYAASQLHLYYELDMMRYFIASMGTARIIILQGISGTGKTSLPYAFGKFVQKDTSVVSVQPSWRERTELYGYYNEFTRKYTETDFLRAIYEANYYRDPHIVILDEMNIARVEYYFAEMLSILEMPRKEEWKVDITSATWDNDPCLIDHGNVQIPDNVWFIGTINNDDSTFAVADKVYDRAIPIDLDNRADAFECEPVDPVYISTDHLNALFDQAKKDYPISKEMLDKLEQLNAYLIKNFRLAFGNRIMKQTGDYVPCFIACGGTEQQAIDFMVAKKVLRKFESLSLGFMKDELTKFNTYLDRLFGKGNMKICQDYVDYLKKNN